MLEKWSKTTKHFFLTISPHRANPRQRSEALSEFYQITQDIASHSWSGREQAFVSCKSSPWITNANICGWQSRSRIFPLVRSVLFCFVLFCLKNVPEHFLLISRNRTWCPVTPWRSWVTLQSLTSGQIPQDLWQQQRSHSSRESQGEAVSVPWNCMNASFRLMLPNTAFPPMEMFSTCIFPYGNHEPHMVPQHLKCGLWLPCWTAQL